MHACGPLVDILALQEPVVQWGRRPRRRRRRRRRRRWRRRWRRRQQAATGTWRRRPSAPPHGAEAWVPVHMGADLNQMHGREKGMKKRTKIELSRNKTLIFPRCAGPQALRARRPGEMGRTPGEIAKRRGVFRGEIVAALVNRVPGEQGDGCSKLRCRSCRGTACAAPRRTHPSRRHLPS